MVASVPVILLVLFADDIAWKSPRRTGRLNGRYHHGDDYTDSQLDEVAASCAFRHCLFAFPSVTRTFVQITALVLDARRLLNTIA